MSAPQDNIFVVHVGNLSDQAYSMTDEEGWEYWWNVNEGLRLGVKNNRLQVFSLSEAGITPEMILRQYPQLDEVYSITTDLTRPLLFVPFKGKDQLIDGWHRLMKAALMGQDELCAYFLTQQEADACLIMKFPPGQGLERTEPKGEVRSGA